MKEMIASAHKACGDCANPIVQLYKRRSKMTVLFTFSRLGHAVCAGSRLRIGLVLVLVIGFFLGIDVTPLIGGGGGITTSQSAEVTPADDRAAQFVSVTLADTEEVWSEIFRNQLGRTYTPPTLVLFKGATQSACGGANGASGPFYCPPEKKAFLDTGFFATMERRMGAGGDFAALTQANRIRAQSSQTESNAISVRIELQADCFSGIWARAVQQKFNSLERGDLDEAMNAARQIGDDTLQRNAGRSVNPHTFTHGTSAQRQRWFATGYETGNIANCDTFSATRL